jgi:hypothetical protein
MQDVSCFPSQPFPHPQPLSQAWERGARTTGSGGVRATELCLDKGDYGDYPGLVSAILLLGKHPLRLQFPIASIKLVVNSKFIWLSK